LIENRECPKPATRDCERTTLIQLAWLWLRNQPRSALSVWFPPTGKPQRGPPAQNNHRGIGAKATGALWKYVTAGVVIEGVTMKVALTNTAT
jgi:transposase